MFPDVVALIREAAGVVAHPTGVSHGTSADAAASGGAQGQGAPTGTTAAGVAPQPPDTSLVLDAEIVGVERDPATGEVTRLAAFQELATRARGEVAVHQVCLGGGGGAVAGYKVQGVLHGMHDAGVGLQQASPPSFLHMQTTPSR
jgi:hypothetical protein